MLTVLMHILLLFHGARCLEPEDGSSLQSAALDLPWQDELCCDSPSAHLTAEGGDAHVTHVTAETNRSESDLPHYPVCSFRGSTNESHHHESSGGTCLDILCRMDGNWEHLRCDLESLFPPSAMMDAGPMAVSLQRLLSQKDDTEVKDGNTAPDPPVVCEGKDSFMCSLALGAATNFVTVVTISIFSDIAPPVLLRIPDRPVRQSPPVNLSHIQTIEAELIVHWDDPPDSDIGPLRYEVRHSPNTAHPAWQVVSVPAEPRLSLELKPRLNYTIQVRCSGLDKPPVWSDWSEPHHIYLNLVSYIPEKVVARPGDNVTVYCVFNDRSINASTAMWKLNFQRLDRSQYHPVNQWVSQITVRPSETQMYDLLQCTQEWTGPYNQIYVEGASININCVTNGDIDAMDCSWKNTQLTNPKFRSRWADLPCDVMEERETAGEKVGEMGPACPQVQSKRETCTIQPLRMNCYMLWLEVPTRLGPIRTKPTYLTPIDHVKPHMPTNVRAVSRSSGVLMVTWEPPSLPAEGLQCQICYHSTSAVRAQPEWKIQSPVRVSWMEVAVSDMCRVYMVQVRCMHTNGTGYWSEWSNAVYSMPQNSRAPERGPDFWRVFQDEPYRNQTNVTLLFEQLQISGHSYCVDGFIVQYQASTGFVIRQQIDMASSYSFQWDKEPQTVTVEAFNNLGSSTNNINMTLERQPKRRFVRSFSVLVINSTCVSLSWSLLDDSSVPLFMVVQWSPQSSAQSSVTYATVLLSDLKQEQQHIHLHDKSGSGNSSSDEGNFSANNSDISDSFRGGLWALDSCRGGEMDDPRRFCSYNSVEELSETSEQEGEEEGVREEKDMYYLEMDYPAEDEESEEDEVQREEETNIKLLNNVVLNGEDCSVESHPLLGPEESSELLSATTQGFSPLYLPQFRTASCTRQLKAQLQDDKPLTQTGFK
uniref:Leptin receptor n=1 Tax=Cyclopterus lumpus TaxID=8103 RepID=A0A8C2ZXD6_CYCLU